MDPKYLNKILLHAIPNWDKKSYIQVWNFEGDSNKEIYESFART